MTKKIQPDRGQTIVEFAFIIVLLFIIVLGIIEFSIILYDKAILTNASREGARAGVVFRADGTTGDYDPLTAAEIRTVVNNYLQGRLVTFGAPFNPATDVTVTRTGTPPSQGGTDGMLDVLVTFRYSFLALPNLGNLGSATLNLGARTIMRIE